MSTSTTSETKTRYFVTKRQMLQYIEPDKDIVISFGRYKRLATDDSAVLKYLDNLLASDRRVDFVECDKATYDSKGPKEADAYNKQAQALAALAFAKGGQPLEIGDTENKPKLNMANTQSSPTTGGQNPATMNISQADTIAALRQKYAGQGTEK